MTMTSFSAPHDLSKVKQPSSALGGVAGLLLALGLSACGGSGSISVSTSGNSTDTNIELLAANTLCSLKESGSQALQYNLTSPVSSTPISESLAFTYNWSCNTSTRVLSGNGVPNHAVTGGQFATKISAQNVGWSIPFSPTKLDTYTNASGPGNAPGYALNSVKFDPATAGTCPNSATGSASCNYAGGVGWQMVALPGSTSPWQFNFGVDSSNAHVQPNGEYHYHGLPTALIDKRNSNNGKSMTLIGWAKDGFPIYTQWGDSSATNGSSTLAAVSSGWTLKPTPDANRPSTTFFPMGHFEQDWEFTGQVAGGLDRCNGHTGPTPESPTGTYHYHVTTSYPFVQRCVYGRTN
jgi:hypothetical protein